METDGTDGTKIHFLRGESTPLRLKTVECDFALCVCVCVCVLFEDPFSFYTGRNPGSPFLLCKNPTACFP